MPSALLWVFLCLTPTWVGTSEASAQPAVHVKAGTRLSLRATSARDESGVLGLAIGLLDDQGAPVGQRTVLLRMHGKDLPQRSAMVETNTDGSALLHAPNQSGPIEVHAEYTGDAVHGPASADLLLKTPSDSPITPPNQQAPADFHSMLDYWTLGPWLLCCLALAWLARRNNRQSGTKPHPKVPRTPMFKGRDGRRATSVSIDQASFEGRIVDDELHLPVSGATVEMIGREGPPLRLCCDHQGHFRSPPLPRGDYKLIVRAAGFSTADVDVQVGAQVQPSDIREVRLTYLRTALWRHYEPLARASTPNKSRAGATAADTPREWCHRLNDQTANALSATLAGVELGLFARDPLSADRLRDLCDALTQATNTQRTDVQ